MPATPLEEAMRGLPVRAFGLALLLILSGAAPAAAQPPTAPPEAGIRAVIGRWYEELARKDEGRLHGLVAPGFIDSTPPVEHARTRSRALGPRIYTSLAAQALKFAWEIDSIRRDKTFARVEVWERGYFYAWAAQTTYERAAATTFILERQAKDGGWLILAHQSGSYGIPPNKVTRPMPDLRALFYRTKGKDRDPAADSKAARPEP
jgi:hypothetical protein